jgi:hypothetical protein
MIVLADSRGVYVRDNNVRWSLFDHDGRFQRTTSALGMGYLPEFNLLLGGGAYLTGEPVTSDREYYFHVFDFWSAVSTDDRTIRRLNPAGPPVVRAFGQVPAAERAMPASALVRPVTAVDSATFWSGPPRGAGRGYELQLWRVDGTLLRTLRRTPQWFPPRSDVAPGGSAATAKPPTQILRVHYLGGELLYVATRVTNTKWRAIDNAAERRAARDGFVDVYVDIIDVAAAVVLATAGPLTVAEYGSHHPRTFFSLSSAGATIVEGPDGLPVVRISDLRLTPRR